MDQIVRADGIEVLLWLVILFFWGLAQVFNRAAKSNKKRQPPRITPTGRPTPPPTPASAPSEKMETQLQDFLRTLGVQTETRIEPPPVQHAEPPPLPQQMVRPRTQKAGPDPTVRRKPEPPLKVELPDLPFSVPKKEVHTGGGQVMSSGFLVKLSGIRMPSMDMGPACAHKGTSGLRPTWRNREDLRKAMVSHIILGTPPGLRAPGMPQQ